MDTLYIQLPGVGSPTPVAPIHEGMLEGMIGAGLARDDALELIYANSLRLGGGHDWAAMLSPRLRGVLSLHSQDGTSSTWTYFDGRPPTATQTGSA